MTDTITITIQRGQPGQSPRFETHEVPYSDGMSVLDAIVWLRSHVDSSIAFRYSCINANACKECMVSVDGKTRYACTTRLTGSPVTVGPLANKTLIQDLVTDIVPPKENLFSILAGRSSGT